MKRLLTITILCTAPILSVWAKQEAAVSLYKQLRLNQIEIDGSGFLTSTGNDPYLTLDNLNLTRGSACFLVVDAEFKEPLYRPRIFELFWATTPRGYSERHKAFFLIEPDESQGRNTLVIPLCKLYGFSGNLHRPEAQANLLGFRLDFPSNETIAVKIESIQFLDHEGFEQSLESRGSDYTLLEPYERLSAKAATSLDVMVPKIVFGIEDGMRKLWKDKGFLSLWLLVIAVLLFRMFRVK